jgi:hypothetical protein
MTQLPHFPPSTHICGFDINIFSIASAPAQKKPEHAQKSNLGSRTFSMFVCLPLVARRHLFFFVYSLVFVSVRMLNIIPYNIYTTREGGEAEDHLKLIRLALKTN